MSQAGIVDIGSIPPPPGSVTDLQGNDGITVSPDGSGIIHVEGTGSLTVSGNAGTNTETWSLTGLTNHNILLGAGTPTINNLAPSATSGVPVISQGAASDPIFGTALVVGGGTGSTSFNVYGPVVASSTSTGALTSVVPSATSGIPLISNGSAATPSFGTALVPGGGTANTSFTAYAVITGGVTSTSPLQSVASVGTAGQVLTSNGPGALPTFQSGAGLTWTDVTSATQTIAAANGYLADRGGGVTFTLPASGTIGDVFRIVGVQGSWTLAQNANQQIKIGSSATTVGAGGSLASTNAGDCIECVATNTSASTVWRVMSVVGNITVV